MHTLPVSVMDKLHKNSYVLGKLARKGSGIDSAGNVVFGQKVEAMNDCDRVAT